MTDEKTLTQGECSELCFNQSLRIFGVGATQFSFGDANGSNSVREKKGVSFKVSRFLNRAFVPVSAVSFNGDVKRGQIKVNALCVKYVFLMERNVQNLKRTANLFLKRRFAEIQAGTFMRAEARNVFSRGYNLKAFGASFASNINPFARGGVLARFGAVFLCGSQLTRLENIPALLTSQCVPRLAFIAIPHTPLRAETAFLRPTAILLEYLAARIASAGDLRLTPAFTVALLRAVFLVRPSHLELRIASGASTEREDALRGFFFGVCRSSLTGASEATVFAKSAVFGLNRLAAMGARARSEFRAHMNLLSKIGLSVSVWARSLGCACHRVINPTKPTLNFTTSATCGGAL